MSLQTRLMAAVIGFVSLILVIVALLTTAMLSRTMEGQLDEQLTPYAKALTQYAEQVPPTRATVENILIGKPPVQVGGLLFAVYSPVAGTSGVIFAGAGGELSGSSVTLSSTQLGQISESLREEHFITVTLDGVGSYRIVVTTTSNGVIVISGLSRAEIQNQLTTLITVIVLATLGGLILLALTTAITIRVTLRPL